MRPFKAPAEAVILLGNSADIVASQVTAGRVWDVIATARYSDLGRRVWVTAICFSSLH
jgi:hypothetical protein